MTNPSTSIGRASTDSGGRSEVVALWLRGVLLVLGLTLVAMPVGILFLVADAPEFWDGGSPLILVALGGFFAWLAWTPLRAALTGRSRVWGGTSLREFLVVVLVGIGAVVILRLVLRVDTFLLTHLAVPRTVGMVLQALLLIALLKGAAYWARRREEAVLRRGARR